MSSSHRRLLACLALALGAPAAVGAAPAPVIPEGLEVGPWILAPVARSSFSFESNPLYVTQSASSDHVAEFQAGLKATLPFRNSRLALDYLGDKLSYGATPFKRDLTHNAGIDLGLVFRSGDRLSVRDVYRRDFLRYGVSQDNEGGEIVFTGEPYNSNHWEVELERADPERQGYLIRVRREDRTFENRINVGSYEYRGFDNVFEYRQPLTSYRSWTLRYATRRFNDYDPGAADVGVPFRREESDSLTYGLRGQTGLGQPYQVQVGYGRFRTVQRIAPGTSRFTGLVGAAAWRLAVGGRTSLNFDMARRALPSSFENYYINNALRVDLDRRWLRFQSRATVRATLNDYGLSTGDCGGGARKDLTWSVEASQGWKVHERVQFEVSSFYEQRNSNCVGSDFDATGVTAGLSLGWF